MNYFIQLLVNFEIYLIVALSLNLIVGYCGLLTLAHAAYYAIGGYTYALLSMKFGLGAEWSILAGALLAALFSLAISLSSWRLKGDFFVLASLAVHTLIYSALNNWTSDAPLGTWRNLTNGSHGISGISRPAIFGWSLSSPLSIAIYITVVTSICVVIVWKLTESPWGRLLKAIRDDELAARGLGKNTRMIKVQVVAISCALAAVAGALYAGHARFLDPTSATLDESILMLGMVIVGGVGNFRGSVVGAALWVALPEGLSFLHFFGLQDVQTANIRMLIYGLLLIGMMLFRPQGISGEYRLQ